MWVPEAGVPLTVGVRARRRAEELRHRLGQEQRRREDARQDLAGVTRALVTASAGLRHLAGRLRHVALVSRGAGGGGAWGARRCGAGHVDGCGAGGVGPRG